LISPKAIIQLTRGLIQNQRTRRQAMFYTSLGSVLILFFGSTVLASTLRNHVLIFVLWWFACAWLMITSVLLAIFDMLMIRAAARREKRNLARRILTSESPDEDEG